MTNDKHESAYEAPRIEDLGDLVALTAAGQPEGFSDGFYSPGAPIPTGGAGGGTPATTPA